jgi:hypothetical protein
MSPVRGFWLGIVLGAALGAGATYLGLERPWQANGTVELVAADAGPDAVEKKRKKRKRRNKRRQRAETSTAVGEPLVVLTAAERKLVWRGPSIALDAKEVDFAGGSDGRALDQGEIDQGIASAADSIIECIKSARGSAELASTITFKALVEGDGRVSRTRVRAPRYLLDHGLYSCVRGAAKRMRFAATGAQTVVSVPFELR